MRDRREKNYCSSQNGNERSDEESEANFRQSLRNVTTVLIIVVAGIHTADNAENDAYSVQEFSKLEMSDSDERLVKFIDARYDSAQQATWKVESATFVHGNSLCSEVT